MRFLQILVLLVLAGIATAYVFVTRVHPGPSRHHAVAIALHAVARKIEVYALDCGALPRNLDELTVRGDCGAHWLGPYVRGKDTYDPWGRPFVYVRIPWASAFVLCSFGADGIVGGKPDYCAGESG